MTSLEAFARVPPTTKDSHYRHGPLPELCRHGQRQVCVVEALSKRLDRRARRTCAGSSSASTGELPSDVPAAERSPRVALRAFGDAEYFPSGVEHRYTR